MKYLCESILFFSVIVTNNSNSMNSKCSVNNTVSDKRVLLKYRTHFSFPYQTNSSAIIFQFLCLKGYISGEISITTLYNNVGVK